MRTKLLLLVLICGAMAATAQDKKPFPREVNVIETRDSTGETNPVQGDTLVTPQALIANLRVQAQQMFQAANQIQGQIDAYSTLVPDSLGFIRVKKSIFR